MNPADLQNLASKQLVPPLQCQQASVGGAAYLTHILTIERCSSTAACRQHSSVLEPGQSPLLLTCSLGLHEPLNHGHCLPARGKPQGVLQRGKCWQLSRPCNKRLWI